MSKNPAAQDNAKTATPEVTLQSLAEQAVKDGIVVPSPKQPTDEEVKAVIAEAAEVIEAAEKDAEPTGDDKPKKFEFARGLAKKYKKPLIAFGAAVGTIVVVAVANAIVAAGRPSEELIEDENPYAETNEVEENPEA